MSGRIKNFKGEDLDSFSTDSGSAHPTIAAVNEEYNLTTSPVSGGTLVQISPGGQASPLPIYYIYAGDGSNNTIDGSTLNSPNSGLNQNVTTVFGDDGDDIIYAPYERNINIFGGNGYDIANYQRFEQGQTITFTTAATQRAYAVGYVAVEEVRGTNFGDTINGDEYDNVIRTGNGANLIYGNGGNDQIFAGSGIDIITIGGRGASTVDGGGGYNVLNFADGFDAAGNASGINVQVSQGRGIYADGSSVTFTNTFGSINGSELADTLIGGTGNDSLSGRGGNDVLYVTGGTDRLDGGTAASGEFDTLSFALLNAGVYLDQSAVTDATRGSVVHSAGKVDFFDIQGFIGTDYNDTFIGSAAADSYYGGAGNDVLRGGGGDDWLEAGIGHDVVDGEAGINTLSFARLSSGGFFDFSLATIGFVNPADPVNSAHYLQGFMTYNAESTLTYNRISSVIGTDFDDQFFGSTGNDAFYSGAGNDVINGGQGFDIIRGGLGDDMIGGGMQSDQINGGQGNDIIRGGKGHDTIVGGIDDDILYGGLGSDTLNGDQGNDTLIGGAAVNLLTGGTGNDIFTFVTLDSTNTITDFQAAVENMDRLDLHSILVGFTNWSPATSDLHPLLQVVVKNGQDVLQANVDAAHAAQYNLAVGWNDVVIFQNAAGQSTSLGITLDGLLSNNQIIT